MVQSYAALVVIEIVNEIGLCLVTSRSLSPTRSMIAWKSSSAAIPSWMLLITANSAARCSLCLNSRCVSSKRRAFSSATLIELARVCSNRTSESLNACSRVTSPMLMTPRA